MSELDKFFKDKLQDRTFEFQDTYWEAAEQLIENEEKKKRKRGGFWWWASLVLLLSVGTISYFMIDGNNTARVSDTNNSTNIETTASTEKEEYSNALVNEKSTTSIDNAATAADEVLNEKNTTGEELNGKINQSTINDQFTTGTGKGIQLELRDKKPLTTDKNPTTPTTINNGEILKIDSTSVKSDTSQTKRPDMAVIDKQELPEEEISSEKDESIAALNPIQTKANDLDFPEAECEDCFDFGKVSNRTFNTSVLAEGIVYPFEPDASWWAGGSLGLSFDYAFNRKFSLRSGVQYAMVRALENSFVDSYRQDVSNGAFSETFDELVYATVENQYGFGLRRVEEYQLPKTIHYLEVPLLVQLRHKRHKFEAGVHWNFLIGARGRALTNTSLFPWERDELGTEETSITSESTEWLPRADFRKVITNTTIGYRYRVSPKFSLALNTYFRLGESTLSEERNGNASAFAIDNEDRITPRRLHFRLGAQWHF